MRFNAEILLLGLDVDKQAGITQSIPCAHIPNLYECHRVDNTLCTLIEACGQRHVPRIRPPWSWSCAIAGQLRPSNVDTRHGAMAKVLTCADWWRIFSGRGHIVLQNPRISMALALDSDVFKTSPARYRARHAHIRLYVPVGDAITP